ncbi:MAG: nucleotidyltransferase domain-containing protein [Acidobacteriia bacterium]|nr:nucleotidyltransferase domain-containing protein [Terriglobia bacterium]
MDKTRVRDLIAAIQAAIPPVLAIYAYGSQVSGAVHPESDLDIAVLMPSGESVPERVLLQLCGDLESLMGCPVDISVLDLGSSVVHCHEVVTGGERLLGADEMAIADFEMRTLSYYARLCEDRRPVLEAYTGEHSLDE